MRSARLNIFTLQKLCIKLVSKQAPAGEAYCRGDEVVADEEGVKRDIKLEVLLWPYEVEFCRVLFFRCAVGHGVGLEVSAQEASGEVTVLGEIVHEELDVIDEVRDGFASRKFLRTKQRGVHGDFALGKLDGAYGFVEQMVGLVGILDGFVDGASGGDVVEGIAVKINV